MGFSHLDRCERRNQRRASGYWLKRFGGARALFGMAAIGDGTREMRIAAVAQSLDTTVDELMQGLWRDCYFRGGPNEPVQQAFSPVDNAQRALDSLASKVPDLNWDPCDPNHFVDQAGPRARFLFWDSASTFEKASEHSEYAAAAVAMTLGLRFRGPHWLPDRAPGGRPIRVTTQSPVATTGNRIPKPPADPERLPKLPPITQAQVAELADATKKMSVQAQLFRNGEHLPKFVQTSFDQKLLEMLDVARSIIADKPLSQERSLHIARIQTRIRGFYQPVPMARSYLTEAIRLLREWCWRGKKLESRAAIEDMEVAIHAVIEKFNQVFPPPNR